MDFRHAPAAAADRRRSERISDLLNIANQLYQRASNAQSLDQPFELPASLDQADRSGQVPPTDPITAQPYTYRRLSDTAYELCASFATDTSTYSLQPPQRPQTALAASRRIALL